MFRYLSVTLLVAWRLQMVFLSLIEGWQQESDDQIRIRWRPPSQGEQSNLRAIMDMYLNGDYVTAEGLSELVRLSSERPELARRHFMNAVAAGEIWAVFHEMGHVLQGSPGIYDGPYARIHDQAQQILRTAEMRGYAPHIGKAWAGEVEADMIAAELLVRAYAVKAHKKGATPQSSLWYACWEVAAGVASALEAIYRIGKLRSGVNSDSYPPLNLRWMLISNYLEQRVNGVRQPEITGMARLIAEISELLP